MNRDAKAFRRGLAGLEPRGVTGRVPNDLRKVAVRCVLAERARGVTWRRLSADLGVGASTLRRWIAGAAQGGAHHGLVPIPVIVEPEPLSASVASSLVLVSPRGYRLEGLDVREAAELLGHLG